MAINGLHSYITTKCKELFSPYELKKQKLVVDGSSTSQYLFSQWKNRNNMFGVDYCGYARCVKYYFENLIAEFDDNRFILVIIDGSWESQQYGETVVLPSKESDLEARHKNRDLFVFSKDVTFRGDVFLDVIKQLKIDFLMCTFEADHTIATIAKIFNCPVLTNNPEFFLYGNDCIFLDFIVFNEHKNNAECNIFGHDQILKKFTGLNVSCLPLLSVLLNQGCFTGEILQCFLKFQQSPNDQLTEHDKIEAALIWLQNQTLDLAAEKVLSWMITTGNSLELSRKLIEDNINHYSTMSTYMLHHLTFSNIFNIPEERMYAMEKKFFAFKFRDKSQLAEVNTTRHIDFNQDVMKKKFERSIPYWFLSEYLNGQYSPFVLYLIKHHAYIPWHELKGFGYPSEYEISIPLLSLIYNLAISCINKGKIKLLSLILEKGNDLEHYGRITLKKELSKLDATRSLDINMRSNIINKDLGINHIEDFQDVPDKWRLYVSTIVFWLKQETKPLKNETHLNAMLLALFFNVVEEKIGFIRDYDFFRKRFHATIERISSRKIFKHKGLILASVMKEITYNDCVMAANFFLPLLENESYSFHGMNDTAVPTDLLIEATHVYSQFKISLEHSKDINALLNFPYQQTVISETFHELLIFNLFIEMSQQSTDIDSYIAEKLKHAPSILKAFTLLRDTIDFVMRHQQ